MLGCVTWLAVIVEIVASIWQSFARLFEFTAGDVVCTSVTMSLSPFLAAYEAASLHCNTS